MSRNYRQRGASRSRGGATRGTRGVAATPRERIRSAPTVATSDLDYITRCEKWCLLLDTNSVLENIHSTIGEFQVMLNRDQMSRGELERLVVLFNHRQFYEDSFATVISINEIFCVVLNSKFVTSKFNLFRLLSKVLNDLGSLLNVENSLFLLGNMIDLLGIFLNKFPNENYIYSDCISHLYERIKNEKLEFLIPFYEREPIHELNKQLSKITISQTTKQTSNTDNYAVNFRAINVYPSYKEIEFPSNTELTALIREGRYENIESYLDIHFKLLREDMIYPLKVAINYLVALDENFANSLFTYDNVRIVRITSSRQYGVVYLITFTPYGLQNIKNYNWERSDRLKYGSLLCLSKKNTEGYPTFNDPLWAVVINQETRNDPIQLSIKFQNGFEENFEFNTEYFMIESREIYFEAYSHTLSVLQDTTESSLPFIDILLGAVNTCAPPQYIDENTVLNIGNLGRYVSEVRLSDEWPECVGLNESQFRALKYAFASRVALIQGAPGTGKTHVGLWILRILLRTREFQMRDIENADFKLKDALCNQPFLVLTQSNHVLDQFLELIMSEERNIVRIGSRSESEMIKPHSLSEIRKIFWKGDNPSVAVSNLRNAQVTVKKELDRIEKIIEKYGKEFQHAIKTSKTIISEENLKIVASKKHFNSLYDTHQAGFKVVMNKKQSMCDIWLRELRVQAKLSEVLLTKQIPLEKNPFAIIAAKDLTIPDGNIIDKYLILERRIEYLGLSEEMSEEELNSGNEQTQTKPQETKKAMKERKILEEAARKFKSALKDTTTNQEIPEYILENSNLWTLKQEEREQLYQYWVKRMIDIYGLVVRRYSDKYASKIKQLEVITTAIDLYILKQATIVGMTTTGAARNAKLIRKLKPRVIIVDEAGEVLESHIITSLTQSVEHLVMIGDPQMLKPSTAVSRLSDQYNLNLSLFERLIINEFRHATLALQHRMRPDISSVMRLIYPMLVDNYVVGEYEHIRGVAVNMYFLTHECYEDPLAEDSTSRSNTHEAYFVIELALYLIKQGYRQDDITILTFYNGQKYLIEDNLSKRLCGNEIKVSTVDKYQGEENEIIILSIVRANKENYIGHCCVDNRTCVAFSRARSGLFVIGNEKCFRLASKKTNSGLWNRILDRFKDLNCIGRSLELYCRLHGVSYEVAERGDFKQINANGCFKHCGKTVIDLSRKCNKSLPCGHTCLGNQGEDCDKYPCTFYKTKQLICRHELRVLCPDSGTDTSSLSCEVKCNSVLKCGHVCKGACFLCYHDNHLECIEKCTRKLVCNHDCNETCHYPFECLPCREIVNYKCEHIQNSSLCGNARISCMDTCEWKCVHLECSLKCSEACDRPRCNDRCSLLLRCGHTCMGICGEKCPPVCRKCKSFDENFQVYFGEEKNAFANFIILDDCGHIFEVFGLDRHVNKSLKETGFNKLPQCPKCSVEIRKPFRYRKTVNQITSNIEMVKLKLAKDTQKIVQEKVSQLRQFTSQNVSQIQILDHLEKAPIFSVLKGNYSFTALHTFSELLRKFIAFFTDDYPLEVWTETSPIMSFFNSEQLECLLNISPQDANPSNYKTLKELGQIFRTCPLYTMFTLVETDKLEVWEKKVFTDIKTRFEIYTQTNENRIEEEFLTLCEAFLFRINQIYCFNFPTTKYESLRRKVTENASGWGRCKRDHLYEIISGKEPSFCPVCESEDL